MSDGRSINTIGKISGQNIEVTQIFAPEYSTLVPDTFTKLSDARPFSIDWLLFEQESIPFFGRADEIASLHDFLQSPEKFSWWAAVGAGGGGKSRLAFEMLRRLPDGWSGGFVPKDQVNVHSAAGWNAKSNTLWVIDYAAGYSDLRQFLAVLFRIAQRSSHKVRILLLERSYNPEVGWWATLIESIAREHSTLVSTLHANPMDLPPLGDHCMTFVAHVAAALPAALAERLNETIAKHPAPVTWLRDNSEDGNPLLLLLLASELAQSEPGAFFGQSTKRDNVIARFFCRELDRLKEHCLRKNLAFADTIKLLFVTTSAYPISYVAEFDRILAITPDRRILLVKNAKGLMESPTAAQLTAMGFDIVEKENTVLLRNLSITTGLENVETYLFLLDEVGFSRGWKWSAHPDRLGEELFRFVINAKSLTAQEKERRPLFSHDTVAELVKRTCGFSFSHTARNWSRLDDDSLQQLVEYLSGQGRSIRLMLTLIRMINAVRSERIPFNWRKALAADPRYGNKSGLYLYFEKLFEALNVPTLSRSVIEELAHDEDAWALPYAEFLFALETRQRLCLGMLICAIRNSVSLSRLTNLSNFCFVVRHLLEEIGNDKRGGDVWTGINVEPFRNAALIFLCDVAYPVLVDSGDKEMGDAYSAIARGILALSFLDLNDKNRSHEDIGRVLRALDIAQQALQIEPDAEMSAYVERNKAGLKIRLEGEAANIIEHYRAALERAVQSKSKKQIADILLDLAHFCYSHRNWAQALEVFRQAVAMKEAGLLIMEEFEPAVLLLTQELTEKLSTPENAETLLEMVPISGELLCHSENPQSHEVLKDAVQRLLTLTDTKEASDAITGFFQMARSCIDAADCSNLFANAILNLAALSHVATWRKWPIEIPFETSEREATPDEMRFAANGINPTEFQSIVERIKLIDTTHTTPAGVFHYHTTTVIEVLHNAVAIQDGGLAEGAASTATLARVNKNLFDALNSQKN